MSKRCVNVPLCVMLTVVFFSILLACNTAFSEERTLTVICQPDSEVTFWESIKTIRGGSYLLGDRVTVDGESDGYCHVIDAGFEASEGWVSSLYLVDGEATLYDGGVPAKVLTGKLRAYMAPNGDLRCRLRKGEVITVYATCGEWAVTDRGYIRSEHLDIQPKEHANDDTQ